MLLREKRSARAEPLGSGPGAVIEDTVTCCKCKRPLPNLPRYLASGASGSGQFQCEDCFYLGTGFSRSKRAVVTSDREAYWRQLLQSLETGQASGRFDRKRAA
jgi:hypothetical protein